MMKKFIYSSGVVCGLLFMPISGYALDQSSPPDSLVVDATGNVGVGTATPTSVLHIKKSGAELTVEDVNPTHAVRNVIKLKNNGGVGFQLEDTSLNNSWDFRTAGNGGFLVSNIGVPGSKLQINKSGAVFLNGTKFILNPAGNLTVAGTSTAVAHISSSSKSVKTDFEKVDASKVLDKIKNLDVTEWRYKDENVKGRHIGPMAEEFYAMFKLGPDDKHVAATDMASIALIAAKELKTENESLKEAFKLKTDQLVSENQSLKKRLASLEKLVTNLASSSETIVSKGKQAALNKK